MSHVVAIKAVLQDRTAVKAAFERLGGTFQENKTRYVWWGRHEGDYRLPDGFSKQELGHCHHAVSFPGCQYEVGIIEIDKLPADHKAREFHKAGSFVPIYDFIERRLNDVMGGPTASNFVKAYGIEKAKLEARRKGYQVIETKVNGKPKLTIHVKTKK